VTPSSRASAGGGDDTEEYFRRTDYWLAWSRVPDLTADIPYALQALTASDRSVLDVPCGRGRLARSVRAVRPDAAVVVSDVNLNMVARARGDVAGVAGVVASVYALPFASGAFDVVLCHQSFMHFSRPQDALAELVRVARSGVYFSVTTGRQLNTLLRRLSLLGTSDVPHWTYNIEDVRAMLPGGDLEWTIQGAFLVGRKALRLSEAAYLRLHRRWSRWQPQWLLRSFGQALFVYGRRRGAPRERPDPGPRPRAEKPPATPAAPRRLP
jgi:SAM-dependent methyltransferase